MRTFRLLSVCLLLAATPAAAQKVNIDFDGATAFSEFKTFQFKDTAHDLSEVRPLLHEDAVARLTTYAVDGGLAEVESDPDVYVAYYVAFSGDLKLALSDLEYAYGPGFRPGETVRLSGGYGRRRCLGRGAQDPRLARDRHGERQAGCCQEREEAREGLREADEAVGEDVRRPCPCAA